jgi:purine-binding chemotaxis protein CheW
MADERPSSPVDPFDDWLASVSAEPQPYAAVAGSVPDLTLPDALSAIEPLADPASGTPEAGEAHPAERPGQRYVLFTVAGSTYAVPNACVTEVGRVPKTTVVPLAPAWLRGVTSLRGDVVSVIDLRAWLGLESASSHTGRLLVVRLLDEEFSTGLLVDAVDQIATVPVDGVHAPTAPLEGALAGFLAGACHVGQRFVAVLDLDRFLRSPEIRQFDDGREAKHEERSCEARI